MKKTLACGAFAAVLLAGAGAASAAPFTFVFSLDPAAGAIVGAPGELVGWGYKLVNEDPTNTLVVTALSPSSFSFATPDSSLFDFPIVAAAGTASQPFDAVAGTGLLGALISPFAVAGQLETGTFTLFAEWWSGDPFAGGTFLRDADPAEVGFSLLVRVAVAPEPSSALLVAIALASCLAGRAAAREKLG
jgi:hypothetical protein